VTDVDAQALASLGIPLSVLIGAGLALVAGLAGLFIARYAKQAGLRKRHPGLLAKYHDAQSYQKLAAAEAAEKAGQLVAAGDLYAALQLSAAARAAYAQAHAFEKVAALQLAEGQRIEAAQSLEKAGEYLRARDVYLEAGKLKEAARAAKLAGDLAGAAALYVQAGDHLTAAGLYQATGDVQQAVAALESAGDALAAARLGVTRVNEHMRSIREGKASSPAKEREIQALAARIAGPLAASESPAEWEQALQLQLFVRNFGAAAELYRRLDKPEKAVEFFLRAGLRRKAADVLDELGRPRESAKLKGEDFVERNMLREAVAQFEAAEEWGRAAELLVKLGDNLKAAVHYQRLENWVRAGELFEADQKYAAAAESYRKAQMQDRALACYEMLQDWGAHSELLESLERWYEAGLSYLKRGLTDKAIKALQRVDESHPQFRDASLKLGDLFQQKGMFGLAKEKYLSILGQERINRANLETHYSLANAYESNGELTQATQTFEKILGFDFHYKDVGQRIADLKARVTARTTPAPGLPAGVDPFAQTLVQPAPQKRRYEIIKELGRGGMGVVYKARDTVLDRIVALKVLPPMFRQNEVALRNFFREAKSAAALSHPNIVTVFDTGEEGGSAYIAMEYVEGQDLKQIVQESGALAIGPVVLIFGQMCQALAYAHDQGIVHRDIKPSNVLWTKNKQCKITDFGLARALTTTANTLTTTGGTPYYMSPEQTLGNNLDHRTDLYSLGVMMFELATGSLPFTEGDVGYHHVHTPPPDPRTRNPKLPAALGAMIVRMLAKKPEDRYPDAASVFDELRKSFSGS
jgi:tetratricopeptide (TPR) repeat protein/predicted Ser/Thr protein kinase